MPYGHDDSVTAVLVLYLWAAPKKIILKIHILATSMWMSPIGQKIHTDSKNNLKKSHTILKRNKICNLDFGKMTMQIFKIV
jgi:hypothetical protein